jgi:hypothetical protein
MNFNNSLTFEEAVKIIEDEMEKWILNTN